MPPVRSRVPAHIHWLEQELADLDDDLKRIATLVGLARSTAIVAPCAANAWVWGGRARVRGALHMAALVATRSNTVIRSSYLRLLAARKPKLVAVTGCMRKLLVFLNALVNHQSPGARLRL